jgi:hypothetical protein
VRLQKGEIVRLAAFIQRYTRLARHQSGLSLEEKSNGWNEPGFEQISRAVLRAAGE